jgi:hypothetical protein
MTQPETAFDFGLSSGTELLLELEPLLESLYAEVDACTLYRLGQALTPLTRPGAGDQLTGELRFWAGFLERLENRPGADATKVGRFRKVLEQLDQRLGHSYDRLVDPLARDPWLTAASGRSTAFDFGEPSRVFRLWEGLDSETRRRCTAAWQRQLAPFQAAADALLRLARDSLDTEKQVIEPQGRVWTLPEAFTTGLLRARPEQAGFLPLVESGGGSVSLRILEAERLVALEEPVEVTIGWLAW